MVEASLQPLCKSFALTISQPGKGFSNGFLQKTLNFSTRYSQQLQQKAFIIGDQNIWVCHQVLSGDRTTSTFIAQSWHSLGFFASIHSWNNVSLKIRKNLHSSPQISETMNIEWHFTLCHRFLKQCWRTCKASGSSKAAQASTKQQACTQKNSTLQCSMYNSVSMFSWK